MPEDIGKENDEKTHGQILSRTNRSSECLLIPKALFSRQFSRILDSLLLQSDKAVNFLFSVAQPSISHSYIGCGRNNLGTSTDNHQHDSYSS